jgi:hypothetical protein
MQNRQFLLERMKRANDGAVAGAFVFIVGVAAQHVWAEEEDHALIDNQLMFACSIFLYILAFRASLGIYDACTNKKSEGSEDAKSHSKKTSLKLKSTTESKPVVKPKPVVEISRQAMIKQYKRIHPKSSSQSIERGVYSNTSEFAASLKKGTAKQIREVSASVRSFLNQAKDVVVKLKPTMWVTARKDEIDVSNIPIDRLANEMGATLESKAGKSTSEIMHAINGDVPQLQYSSSFNSSSNEKKDAVKYIQITLTQEQYVAIQHEFMRLQDSEKMVHELEEKLIQAESELKSLESYKKNKNKYDGRIKGERHKNKQSAAEILKLTEDKERLADELSKEKIKLEEITKKLAQKSSPQQQSINTSENVGDSTERKMGNAMSNGLYTFMDYHRDLLKRGISHVLTHDGVIMLPPEQNIAPPFNMNNANTLSNMAFLSPPAKKQSSSSSKKDKSIQNYSSYSGKQIKHG